MSLPRTSIDYLTDMIEEAELARTFIQGHDATSLRGDRKTLYAVVRALTTIGEAAKKVLLADQSRSPSVPWKRIMGMRDRLVHQYFDINLDVVWSTVTEDIPSLIPLLRQLRDLALSEEPPIASENT